MINFLFLNISQQKLTHFTNFGTLDPEKCDVWTSYRFVHELVIRCSHFTLGNPKKSLSTVLFRHTSDYLRYLIRKQTVIHLPNPPENVTTLTYELQNFFIWLKVCCTCSSKCRWLWKEPVVMCGNWNQRQSKCSEWPPSALIHACGLFRHLSFASSTTEIQPMSQQAAAATRPYRRLVLDTRAPPVACPRRSNRAMQIIGSTKQQ